MDIQVTPRKRRGGRSARKELRAAPPTAERRAVRPGLEGGAFRPLTESQVKQIHRAALEAVSTIGLGDAPQSCIDLVTAAGGTLTDGGRLLFPAALVEDIVATAGRHFVLHGQTPEHDMEPWGSRVYFGTAGAAVHIVDAETGDYRESMLADLYDIARLVDTLEHVHFFQRPIVARDLASSRDLDVNTCYASITGTTKHVGSSWVKPAHVDETLQLLHMVADGEKAWRERPFVSMSNCFVVPPLKFTEDACFCLEAAVRGGMPVLLLAAGQAGATSPAALAGAVVQQVAEVLAGLVYVNLLNPGHPAIFGTWPFVSDLRTGAMSGGSGEQALLMAACAQMAQFYDLTGGVAAGMTDSKVPDTQAGAEKGYTTALVANAGGNMIYESAGMQASLLGFSMEGAVIDNDVLGGVLRTVRGIEVTEETLSLEVMREVCTEGPGHFLGHAQTMALMESEYVYPAVGDRSSPKEWAEKGLPWILQQARARTRSILDSHFPGHIDAGLDARIRETFDIKLPRANMQA